MAHPWEAKWTVGNRLGKGGQGVTHEVSLVDDTSIRGALKYLKNNRDSQARARMRREVANLQTLASQGGTVPRVLDHNTDAFEDASTELFVVMDLIAGSTLRAYVDAHGPLDIGTSVLMVLSLCKTIEIAHSFPILHRDLKPENIIVHNDNAKNLVIVDYGLSFNTSDEKITETSETFRNSFLDLPETNTPSGDRRDHRSDLTAVCAILYFCLTKHVVGQLQDGSGTLPHLRDGYSLRNAIKSDTRVTQIETFLTRGFSPNVANRFQDVKEIVAALSTLVGMSKEIDESDPLQVAVALSEKIRLTDRKTQIAEFAGFANELWQFLQKEHDKYSQKLGRFTLTFEGGGVRGIDLKDGLDLVAHWQLLLTLQAAHHLHKEHRQYLVGSRGEQCVLLAADSAMRTDNTNRHVRAEVQIKEVGWYEGRPSPIFQLAAISLRDWITEKMKKLAAEILASTAKS